MSKLTLCVLSIGAGLAVCGCLWAPAVAGRSEAPMSVDRILQSRFERIAGPAAGGAVLDTGPSGSWREDAVVCPTIDFDGKLYRMWFVGYGMTDDPGVPYGWYERIGLATSTDGVRWTVANEGRPVFDLGPEGSFDAKGIAHPYVLRVADGYMMWYSGVSGETARDIGLEPGHVRLERIGLATSPNGIDWTRQNDGEPVMDVGPEGSIDTIQLAGAYVLQIDGRFVMWYGPYNGTHTIGIATSPDGIHWTKGNDGKPVTGLEGKHQAGGACVYFDGARYLMLYNHRVSTGRGGSLWKLFAATSPDGANWHPAHGGAPLLGPAPPGNFGSADGVHGNNHSVHPTRLLIHGNRVRTWYFAEGNQPEPGSSVPPNRIGLMEARVE